MSTGKKNYVLPIIVMFFLFAMISFVTGFQNPFGVILKEQLSLNNIQSQLGNLANFIAYLFMGLPAGYILQKKGYKVTAVLAVVVGLIGVTLMFCSSLVPINEKNTIFIVYLIGAFIAGFSMCMLNTVVNPMLNTLGGGGKKGNQLIQFGGSLNSLAATICPILVGYLMGSSLRNTTLVDARPALYIAMGIFFFTLIVLLLSRLPEPILEEQKLEGNKKSEKPTLGKAFKFSHYVGGVVAIFLYVGVEVGIPNFANLYMTAPTADMAQQNVDEYNHQQSDAMYLQQLQADAQANPDDEAAQTKIITDNQFNISRKIISGELGAGLGMAAGVAGTIVGMYWLLMLVGRLLGGFLGGLISPRKMLTGVAAYCIICLLCAICLDSGITVKMPGVTSTLSFEMVEVSISVLFLVLCGLGTSVMWGGIFNLATEGLGKYTAVATGFFMVMVCGGGVLPILQGAVADWSGYLACFWIPLAAVTYLLYYALVGSRVRKRDREADVIAKEGVALED